MQGDFGNVKKVKKKLMRLREGNGKEAENVDNPQSDIDGEVRFDNLKRRLFLLLEKIEEACENREITKGRFKHQITKLSEKLLKVDEDSEVDSPMTSEWCSKEKLEPESEANTETVDLKHREASSTTKYIFRCTSLNRSNFEASDKEVDSDEITCLSTESDTSEKFKLSRALKRKLKAFLESEIGFRDKPCEFPKKNKEKGISDLWRKKGEYERKPSLRSRLGGEKLEESRHEPGDGSKGKLDAKPTVPDSKVLEKPPKERNEREHRLNMYFQRSGKIGEVNRRLKSQIWSSVVTIVLVEGKNLQAMDIDGLCDSYVKFRLGNEKYKSKIAFKSLNPSWLEQFDFHLYDDQSQELEVTVWNKDKSKDDFMGRCNIDLSVLEREKTHGLWHNLEEGGGCVHLLLTISGTTASETISDLSVYEDNLRERQNIESRYVLKHSLHNLRDVGHLTVKVYRATGLAAADLGGKSDPFCVLELVNARLQTQTEYKTLSPSWQKIFTFNVKDINSVLEVTVYDEDRDHKVEFLGKVAIPLLRIRNGEKKWYCLKDKKLRSRAKGNCPMILLEMYVLWNPVRAWIRTLNPKEEKYMQAEIKFKRQVFVRNVLRLKAIIMNIIGWGKFIQDCFEREHPVQSAVALVLFIVFCYCFEPYMIPAVFLLVFLKYYIVMWLTGDKLGSDEEDEVAGEDEEDDEDKDKEEKKSLKERLQAIQEVTQTVQNAIGYIASLGEQVKNTFNFTVPFVSYLAIALSLVATMVMYVIPFRYLIIVAVVNKFARKLIRPHTIPNNEILDLLSRVPDDEDLIAYREFRPYSTSDIERRREQRKKHKAS